MVVFFVKSKEKSTPFSSEFTLRIIGYVTALNKKDIFLSIYQPLHRVNFIHGIQHFLLFTQAMTKIEHFNQHTDDTRDTCFILQLLNDNSNFIWEKTGALTNTKLNIQTELTFALST